MRRVFAVGVDFGTSNSCVCHACYKKRPDGTLYAKPIKRPEPLVVQYQEIVPTAVFVGTDEEPPLYGEIAEEKSVYYPELTRTHFKLDVGAPGPAGSRAADLTRDFLHFLFQQLAGVLPVEDGLPDAEFVTYIGHPVQWNAQQRLLTLKAAQDAAFPNVMIEDETSAAVYNHLCEERLSLPADRATRVLVLDMGGGTTDFAFVDLPADRKEVPVTTPVDPYRLVRPWQDGHFTYGGRDLDLLLLRHFASILGLREGSRNWAFLLRETRRFKEQFSTALSHGRSDSTANWFVDDAVREVNLSRADFEAVSREFLAHLPRLLEAALQMEKLRPDQIDAVVLTGGSSRWYWVENALREVFPHLSPEMGTLVRHRKPEQSVARGLAYRRMVEALGGRPRPRRRATHAIWIGSPPNPARESASTPRALAGGTGGADAVDSGATDGTEATVMVMDRGQLLPYRTAAPITLLVEKFDFDLASATLNLKLYTGSAPESRDELIEQVARFDRSFLERLLKRFAKLLPWSTWLDRDKYGVEVICSVDENELFTAQVSITRYYRGLEAGQVVQVLQMEGPDAKSGTESGGLSDTGGVAEEPVTEGIAAAG